MRIRKSRKPLENPLITVNEPRSPVTEAFRTLRTNIQFAALDRTVKSIVITGAMPSVGKSTVTANLGVILAQTGSSVLLVDSDLRKPMLHRIFNCDNNSGLTNLLIDVTLNLNKVVYSSRIENLHVLASGPIPPNPAELLASEKMKGIAGVLADTYDYVIYDSPPVIMVTDGAILSRIADATILTLSYGYDTRDAALQARELLNKAQANIIGVVINDVPANSYGYYYYYQYYGDQNAKPKKEKPRYRKGGLTRTT